MYGSVLIVAAAYTSACAGPPDDLTFEGQIRPILKAHCFHCHGEAGELNGGLDVRLRRLLASGGDSGPAIVPGQRHESILFGRVELGEMPPEGKPLSKEEVELIGRWIDAGAATAREEPDDPNAVFISEEERAFWAFQPIRRPLYLMCRPPSACGRDRSVHPGEARSGRFEPGPAG